MNLLQKLARKQDNLQDKIDKIEDLVRAERSRLAKTVTMTVKGKSKILICNGKALSVPDATNSYGERTVYWYDMNKGKRIGPAIENERSGYYWLKIWLAVQAEA